MKKNKDNNNTNDEIDKLLDDVIHEMTNNAKNNTNYSKKLGMLADKLTEKVLGHELPDGISFDTYMNKPILTIAYSRRGTNICGGECYGHELPDAVENICRCALNLMPKEMRTRIIMNALNGCDNDKGELFDEEAEESEGDIQKTIIRRIPKDDWDN